MINRLTKTTEETAAFSDFFGSLSLGIRGDFEELSRNIQSWVKLNSMWSENSNFFEELQENIVSAIGRADEYSRYDDPSNDGHCYIHQSARIRSPLYVSGTCLIGPGANIGPVSYLRDGTIVGAGCRVGFTAELKSSLLMDRVICSHRAYAGHSVLGENSIIGAGAIFAARRLDDRPVRIRTASGIVQTAHFKVGSFVERGTKIRIGTLSMPGTVHFLQGIKS